VDPVRILWVKANKLLPVHSGGDIRSFNILRQLALENDVTFFSYYDGARDREYEKELERQLPGAVSVCTRKRLDSTWARGWHYLSQLAHDRPYAVSRFASPAVQKALRNWVTGNRADVVVCDFLDAAINFPHALPIPAVLFQHNVESEIWRRYADNAGSWPMRILYGREYSRMVAYERAAVRRFSHVIAVSEHDKKLMTAWVEAQHITVVPTGVDTEQFRPREPWDEEKPLVVFVGAMDWPPNVDAVQHFCAEMWPSILAKLPQARFRIVGRNPARRVQALASDSVEVTGRVASVVDHLREAAVVVVPLRVGGGTRLKIYEAMAVGKAVVSTTVGAEGLDVTHGTDLILADSPIAFAESVIQLLVDPETRRRQGEAAAQRAAKYGWPLIANRFAAILRQLVTETSETSATPALASAGRQA
jgi:polysaccharide biosynthesis protein PslH